MATHSQPQHARDGASGETLAESCLTHSSESDITCCSEQKEQARDVWAGMDAQEREAAAQLWQWPAVEVDWDGKLGKRSTSHAAELSGKLAQQERAKVRVSVDGLLLLSGRRTRGKLGKGDVAGQKARRRERLRLEREAQLHTPFPAILKGKRTAGRRARTSFVKQPCQPASPCTLDSDASDPLYDPIKGEDPFCSMSLYPSLRPPSKRHRLAVLSAEGCSSVSSLTGHHPSSRETTPGPLSGTQMAAPTHAAEGYTSPVLHSTSQPTAGPSRLALELTLCDIVGEGELVRRLVPVLSMATHISAEHRGLQQPASGQGM
ncbi:hypothetical protein WJX84_010930 [Apatococcus fuscideae]|uniref:Uncharacterized protein n=1 Tax=Apatococcus fuscideae TaxID=2026836 RepID=A0AAW1TG72_9CHLO